MNLLDDIWQFDTVFRGCILYSTRDIYRFCGMGAPPYYMIAFTTGGIPTTSFIGIDPYNLTWTVNQASGEQGLVVLMLEKAHVFT